jgi:glycine/D-amino acid oxidase-like deaminating enzyme
MEGHRLASTYALATRPQKSNIPSEDAIIWEASDPYLYIRSTIEGRVLVGGEDEDFADETARDALLPSKIKVLQEKLKQLMPWLDVRADFAWAGTFGESAISMPSIGPVLGMPNCYAVLGFGGNGFTFGVIAAQIIAHFLSGAIDPDAELFALAR